MITMRAQLAPALLLLILLAAAAPLVPALSPQEIRDRKINGANKLYIMSADPAAYAGEKKSAPESKEEAPNDVAQKTSYVKGAGTEPKPESKRDEKVLEDKIQAEVKQMRKEAAYDDAVAEKKAKEFKSKPKNTTDDAEDQAKDKKSKGKLDYSEDAEKEKKEKKSKNKDDDSEEKKSKSKSEDDIDDKKKEKKSKSKDDDDDEKKEKKSKSKDEDEDEKKEKKSKSKEEDDTEKKSKEKSESSEDAGEKKKKSKSKNKDEDFDAVPIETKADESVPAADTPDGYAAPTKKTPPYQAPTTTMSAADTPDGYLAPKKAEPKMSAADTPDGYAAPTTTMSAADTPDGYVPATDSPDGGVPASDSPDGYAVPWKKPKLNVQSFEDMVPRPLLNMLSPTVKTLCAKTRFPYTCETSIAKLPETSVVPARQKDGLGVLTLAVDAVRAKLAEAKNAAKQLTVDPRTDKISKSAISDCMQMYDDINTSYDTALAALKRGDKPTATTAFDAARTFVDTCDNGFLDRPGLRPVIGDQEKILAELSSNVLAINKYT